MSSAAPEIVPLFATPLVTLDVPEAATLNSELRRVIVPFEHTEAWYSTLNQARLLMNEEFDLATAEERHLAKSLGPEIVGSDRLLLIAQYELYSFIQSILVEKVMQD